uniref:AB hydrolase-1 domain-containing protein n=1 Tax=Sciurus vulgaris TaxID=55149 RepID=A0A8D2CWW0_SCIVU
ATEAGCYRSCSSHLRSPGFTSPCLPRTSVTSAKVSVNGVHLHYQQAGEGEHAVLLLSGMLGCGKTDFAPQLKKQSKKLFTVEKDFQEDFIERDAKDAVDLMKMLKFKKFSLLGWSDSGITALFAAAKYPSYINKMVIWGANAYVTEEDERIYQGIWDAYKCSEKTRKPIEALYGYDYLVKTCEKWVDGIGLFKHLPDGKSVSTCYPWFGVPP